MGKYLYQKRTNNSYDYLETQKNAFHVLYYFLGLWNEYSSGEMRGEYMEKDVTISFEGFMEIKNAKENLGTFRAWYFIKKGHKYLRALLNLGRTNQAEFADMPFTLREIRRLGYSGTLKTPCFPLRAHHITKILKKICFDSQDPEMAEAMRAFVKHLYSDWCEKPYNMDFLKEFADDLCVTNTRDHFVGFLAFVVGDRLPAVEKFLHSELFVTVQGCLESEYRP